MKILLTISVLACSVCAPAQTEAAPATTPPPATRYALAFGTLVMPKEVKAAEPGTGLRGGKLEWWLAASDGSPPRPLVDPQSGRAAVTPIDRTIQLARDDQSITLLGADGRDLVLSLTDGPLAEARIHRSGQRTTFAFSPDGATLAFVNQADELCRINLRERKLERTPLPGISAAEGVRYRRDGKRIAYARYSRANHGKVYAADPDGCNELELSRLDYRVELGFDFLPDGRVGVVGPHEVTAFDADTGKAERVAGPWANAVEGRNFAGFHPDGTSFLFDTGGPYLVRLHRVEIRSGRVELVKGPFHESFQEMAWVKVSR